MERVIGEGGSGHKVHGHACMRGHVSNLFICNLLCHFSTYVNTSRGSEATANYWVFQQRTIC